MYTNNPYAHAGWPNANPNAVNMGSSGGAPSVFGALPFTGPSSPAAILTFYFEYNPDIMNCIVKSKDGSPYFRIMTSNPHGGFTGIQDLRGDAVALVEWKEQPMVEVHGRIPRQRIAQWLALSPQRDRRRMIAGNAQYVWVPSENDISLFAAENTTNPVARIVKQGQVRLEITANSIHIGQNLG
ncbi:hypothetical protein ONZ45_g6983 [Pleurotus djamor]|nr:hypothetical protein ONZ45_g6983 [Pleurotus djamor]